MKNILILILVAIISTSQHHQYAMEQEKTLSRNIESLRDRALSVYLEHADFNNISIQELPNLEFLDLLPQAPKIAEYLRNKYSPHYKILTKDICFSLTNISSFSFNGQILLITDLPVTRNYELDRGYFKLQKTRKIEYKDLCYVFNLDNSDSELEEIIHSTYIVNPRITQFGPNNYIIWDMTTYQEYNPDSKPVSLKNNSNKEIVGMAKSDNCNNIFVAKSNGKKLSIVKECINKKFEIIDKISFRKPISPDKIIVSKNSGCVILEDKETKEKFIWDPKKGTYSSLARFIKPSDEVTDVLNNYVLVKSHSNATNCSLNLQYIGSKAQEIFFSRKYPTHINALNAKFIERNNQIIGIITNMQKFYNINDNEITATLFNTRPVNPTEIIFYQIIDNGNY